MKMGGLDRLSISPSAQGPVEVRRHTPATPALTIVIPTRVDLLREAQDTFQASRSPNTAGTEELITWHIFTQHQGCSPRPHSTPLRWGRGAICVPCCTSWALTIYGHSGGPHNIHHPTIGDHCGHSSATTSFYDFFLMFIYLFIFDCAGSSCQLRLFSSCGKRGLLSST